MVAASKLKRVQPRVEASQDYFSRLEEIVSNVVPHLPEDIHPYLLQRSVRHCGLLVIAGDRGLCGGHNAGVLRMAEEFVKRCEAPVRVIAVGVKAKEYALRRGWEVVEAIEGFSGATHSQEGLYIARAARMMFEDGTYDTLDVAYTRFVSPVRRIPEISRQLPLVVQKDEEYEFLTPQAEYIFSPEAEKLLAGLLPRMVEARIVNLMLQATASEHAARMTAMSSATDNAEELGDNLSRVLNRARQQEITTELLEVVAGAAALEQDS